MTLVSKPVCEFTGCDDVRPEYLAWFDAEKQILHHVSGPRKNALGSRVGKCGYLSYSLLKSSGLNRGVFAHRLVCEYFNGTPPVDKPQVNHINHNRVDNRAVNLEWSSPAGNTVDDPSWRLSVRILSVRVIIDGVVTVYKSCSAAAHALGYPDVCGLAWHLKPLLKGEVDSVTFYSRKLGKQVSVCLA